MEAIKSFISKIPYPYKIYFFFDIIILFCLIISLLLELVIKSFIGVFFYLLIILIPNGLNFLVNFLTKYDYSSFYGFKIILNFILYFISLFLIFLLAAASFTSGTKMRFFYFFIFILSILFGSFVIISFFISLCLEKDDRIDVKNLIKQGLIQDDGLENNNNQ